MLDLAGFDQSRMARLHHQLSSHPLLTMDQLAALALRSDPRHVRFHDGERTFSMDLGAALGMDEGKKALERTLQNLDRRHAFVQILNVRADPLFRKLVDECLDEVQACLPRGDGLLNRDAAAFLASPGSVTPYHLDHEQNFLCHVAGAKRLYVWDHSDRSVVPERALEVFYRKGGWGDPKVVGEMGYRPAIASKATVFDLAPGDVVYMPMGSPHAVETGRDVTATLSILFNSRFAMKRVDAYRANYVLRGLGLAPRPIGVSPVRDGLKRTAFEGLRAARALLRGKWPSTEVHWY